MNSPNETSEDPVRAVMADSAEKSSHDKHLWRRVSDWFIESEGGSLISGVLGLVVMIAAIYWLHVKSRTPVVQTINHFQSWTEHRSILVATTIVAFLSLFSLLSVVQLVYVRYWMKGAPTNLRWLYFTIGLLVLYAGVDLWWWVLNPSPVMARETRQHAMWYSIHLHCDSLVLLLAAGCAVYVFKQKWLLGYGMSEVLVSILSNLAVIDSVDLSHLPHLALTSDQVIKLGAFTYLLSRGVSNITDALKASKAEAAEKQEGLVE